MRVSVNIEKRYAYIIIGLLIIIAGGFAVYAAVDTSQGWHSASQIEYSDIACSEICNDAAGGGSLWSQNGSFIYYNTDNVGIGTGNPSFPGFVGGAKGLQIEGHHAVLALNSTSIIGVDYNLGSSDNGNFFLSNGDTHNSLLIVSPDGNVDIGRTGYNAKLQVIDTLRLGGNNKIGYLELAATSSNQHGGRIYVKTFTGIKSESQLSCDSGGTKISVDLYGNALYDSGNPPYIPPSYNCKDGILGFCGVLCFEATKPLS